MVDWFAKSEPFSVIISSPFFVIFFLFTLDLSFASKIFSTWKVSIWSTAHWNTVQDSVQYHHTSVCIFQCCTVCTKWIDIKWGAATSSYLPLHVCFFGSLAQGLNFLIFFIFVFYSASDLMFWCSDVLACWFMWHLDPWLWLWSNLCCCMLIFLALASFGSGYDLIFVAACWVVWLCLKVKKNHLCALFCNQSNVWCSDMLACRFLWHLDPLALAMI